MSKRKPKPQQATPVQNDLKIAAFEALISRHSGHISPRLLLDAARDVSSPFHDQFEWDDEVAGEQYRLMQAAALIRRWKGSVMIIDTEAKRVTFEVSRRVQSPLGQRRRGGESFETVEQIMADPAKREDMLRTVLRELAAYRKRYAQLSELAQLWAAIDEALETNGLDDRTAQQREQRPPA